jgi:hypothetical protein
LNSYVSLVFNYDFVSTYLNIYGGRVSISAGVIKVGTNVKPLQIGRKVPIYIEMALFDENEVLDWRWRNRRSALFIIVKRMFYQFWTQSSILKFEQWDNSVIRENEVLLVKMEDWQFVAT